MSPEAFSVFFGRDGFATGAACSYNKYISNAHRINDTAGWRQMPLSIRIYRFMVHVQKTDDKNKTGESR